jgi:hypothetical protein
LMYSTPDEPATMPTAMHTKKAHEVTINPL